MVCIRVETGTGDWPAERGAEQGIRAVPSGLRCCVAPGGGGGGLQCPGRLGPSLVPLPASSSPLPPLLPCLTAGHHLLGWPLWSLFTLKSSHDGTVICTLRCTDRPLSFQHVSPSSAPSVTPWADACCSQALGTLSPSLNFMGDRLSLSLRYLFTPPPPPPRQHLYRLSCSSKFPPVHCLGQQDPSFPCGRFLPVGTPGRCLWITSVCFLRGTRQSSERVIAPFILQRALLAEYTNQPVLQTSDRGTQRLRDLPRTPEQQVVAAGAPEAMLFLPSSEVTCAEGSEEGWGPGRGWPMFLRCRVYLLSLDCVCWVLLLP